MQTDQWLGLELRHLVALRAVAEEGTFGAAARKLGYTQSAVSQQIATLERIVGQRLIDRPGGPRPVSLTDAGHLLLGHAEGITARLQAAHADLEALGAGDAGVLRIGTYQSVGARILPTILAGFKTAWPKVEITLTESADDRELLALVERGDLDLTFSDLPLEEGPFQSVEPLRDPYVLVVPADSDLAQPTLRDVTQMDLIGHKHCRTLVRVAAAFRRPLNYVFQSDHNQTVQALVAAGVGNALVPRLTVDEHDPATRVIELPRIPPRMLAVAWHRDRYRTPAARAFVETAQAVCAELSSDSLAAA